MTTATRKMSDEELYGAMQRELLEWWREQVRGVDVETLREKSLLAVKTFKTIKQVIWQSARVLDEDGNEIVKVLLYARFRTGGDRWFNKTWVQNYL